MLRIDNYPTHKYKEFGLRHGKPLPFGSSLVPGGVNFSVFSSHATACELVLFRKHETEPYAIIPFLDEFRIGNVFSMVVFDLDVEEIEYGFKMDGPFNPAEGHRFDKTIILMDPYAKAIGGRDVWGDEPDWQSAYQHRARIALDDFDWGNDRPLEIPTEDLIIYETHVRSFTRHPSSRTKYPGTFAAVRDKIPYLKRLGINCVELMPVHEFDEFENSRISPASGERLMNYWGYSNVGFFAPKAGYAATGKFGMQVDELKALVKDLHTHGIEIILDVVFNHTAEGDERGPTISYRGIDNKTYYMLTPAGAYYNFSGCGNTLNCNNPIVRNMILDCLRYWAAEYHVDGFRFDLASILGRAQDGAPMPNPPLIETLAFDPVLGKCKLIAEAWDPGGLYQVGSFPAWGRWGEWNGKFRDDMRRFLKGDAGIAGAIGQRIQGSPDMYRGRGTTASVNFITCHDGFTLMDLVSYNGKHNEANGENNNDGADDNNSWNCGEEGPSADPEVNTLRRRQIKNAVTMLMLSQGVPMVLSGDEIGKTQSGNNNAYCQDNEISWLDWSQVKSNSELLNFFTKIIAFRNSHPMLRNKVHLRGEDYLNKGYADISWHGVKEGQPDWSSSGRLLAFMLCGEYAKEGTAKDDFIYAAMNMHWESHACELPVLPAGKSWRMCIDTGMQQQRDAWSVGEEMMLGDQKEVVVGPRSIVVAIGK